MLSSYLPLKIVPDFWGVFFTLNSNLLTYLSNMKICMSGKESGPTDHAVTCFSMYCTYGQVLRASFQAFTSSNNVVMSEKRRKFEYTLIFIKLWHQD